jgi:AcrR family transcriptional regulator
MPRARSATRRDPERTRRAIVEAALEEYSRHGPAGARVDRIAAAAGVNKRMIYHYFGSKEGLWTGLLDAQWAAEPVLSSDSSASIAAQLTNGVQRVAARPAMTRLLAWEALTDSAASAGSDALRAGPWQDRIAGLVDAQRDGRLAPRVDAAQLELALTALLLFPAVFPQITRMITGYAVADPAFATARAAFFQWFSEVLTAVPAAPPTKPRFRLVATVTEVGRADQR